MTRFLPTLKPSTWILILGMFVGFGAMLWPEFALAQDGIGTSAESGIKGFLYILVINLTGWFLWVGGMLLDYSINTFVIEFGTIFNTGGVGEAVNQLWSLVRDLFNILFIFGLVFIGFKMILNSDDAGTKRNLIYLIIAALLINFSLFITKFVVDFTNILASEIAVAGFESSVGPGGDAQNIEIGNTFFGLMGITSFLDPGDAINNGTQSPYAFIFGVGIINIVGAFAFGVGGIMLIIRFIALSIYMVLSPMMFLGFVFPGFANMSSKYWSGFLKQAFYAPVYIIMIFFAASILDSFFGRGGNGSAEGGTVGALTGQNNSVFNIEQGASVSDLASNFAGGMGPFILSAGFLIAAVQVAGKLSADGSGIMAKVGGAVNSRVRGAVRGGALMSRNIATAAPRYIGRSGANRAGNLANAKLANWQTSQNKYKRAVAGNLLVDEGVRGAATRLKSTKAGFSNTVDERNAKQTKINSRQEAGLAIQAGVVASAPELNTFDPKKIYDPKTGNIVEKTSLNATDLKVAETAQTERETAKAKMYSKIRDLSGAELEQMFNYQPELFEAIVGDIDDGKIEKLFESDNLNSADKNKLFGLRKTAIENSFTENGIKVQSEFAKVSIKQIEMLGDSFVRDNAELFTQDQLDGIKKSDKFTATQKGTYNGVRKARIKEILTSSKIDDVGSLIYANSGTVEVTSASGKKNWIKRLEKDKFKKPAEIASLPIEALTAKSIIGDLPVDAIKQIGRDFAAGKSHMSATEIDTLFTELQKNGSTKVTEYLKTARAQRDFKDAR